MYTSVEIVALVCLKSIHMFQKKMPWVSVVMLLLPLLDMDSSYHHAAVYGKIA